MIDHYNFGEIIIDGKTYTSDVIIYPNRVDSTWWRKEGHKLQTEDITEIVNEKPEVLVVGTGRFGMMRVMPEVENLLKSLGIQLVAEKTETACREYNRLKGSRKVVAALHLTC